MTEATELLDAVTRLVTAIKSGQEDKLSAVLGPAIEYLVSMDKADRAARTSQYSTFRPPVDPVSQLERYVALCEKMKLDPKDKATRKIIEDYLKAAKSVSEMGKEE